ncbi:MAG: NDP-sugar synthase [Candidatus Bathyarchaeota archaeon]|nr:NDP-sugar synthase [Candidatus Bathyarchaeota archaeon]
MKDDLLKLQEAVNAAQIEVPKLQEIKNQFLRTHVTALKIDNYIGDYPTFMEPVVLGDQVKIGDDVLIGPNVYIGKNSEIGDYVELSNSILLDNVIIGNNFKLNNCIVASNSNLNFDNYKGDNCIIKGNANSKEELKLIPFE